MKGYIQVYTGNGKGKTTAAFGLSLRAAGNGKKIFIGQFVKSMLYAEIKSVQKFLPDNITTKQYGLGCFIEKEPTQKDIDAAIAGLNDIKNIIQSEKYDIVILDEANIAIYFKLFSDTELIEVLKQKPENIEIIITGRYATDKIIEFADLVTEMKEVKHYYNIGVQARDGIER